MPNAESLLPRPTLLNPGHLADTVAQLGHHAPTKTDIWRLLRITSPSTSTRWPPFCPCTDPEPHWLPTRR